MVVWTRFYAAMQAWEQEMVDFQRRDLSQMHQEEWDAFMASQRQKLIAIFETCTVEGARADRLTEPLSYPAGQTEYDLDRESVEHCEFESDSEVLLVTKRQTALGFHHRYRIQKAPDQWRVKATREFRASEGRPWQKRSL